MLDIGLRLNYINLNESFQLISEFHCKNPLKFKSITANKLKFCLESNKHMGYSLIILIQYIKEEYVEFSEALRQEYFYKKKLS